ncbi:MAG TPA: YerC/YecD family TrpR-related protein [Woeseiaceae bacterium]
MKPNREIAESRRRESEDALFGAIVSLRDVQECRRFFSDLCTPAELQALADRWQVVGLLEQRLPYRRIHELTGVSVTTIGRVARYLSEGFGGYRLAFERVARRQRRSKLRASH